MKLDILEKVFLLRAINTRIAWLDDRKNTTWWSNEAEHRIKYYKKLKKKLKLGK